MKNGKNISGNILPAIRPAVISASDIIQGQGADIKDYEKLDLLYAKDYHVYNDAQIILKSLRELGKKTV